MNALLPDAAAQATPRASAAPAADFAAVARSVAAGDLEAARKALAASGSPDDGAQLLGQTLAEGNLAAARLALAQLGVDPFATHAAGSSRDVTLEPPPAPGTRDVTVQPAPPPVTRDVSLQPAPLAPSAATPGAPTYVAPTRDSGIAAAVNAAAQGRGMVIADVGNSLAEAAPPAPPSGGTVTSVDGKTYAVSDVLLALALGNAGTIPADVINLYGPGGARYDPAAIMDAYRNSDLGKSQIAALSWVGRPV